MGLTSNNVSDFTEKSLNNFTKNVWFHKFYRFRRSRDWKYSVNSYMKVQMPQQDLKPRRHWSHFRILVTGNDFTEFHVFSRDFMSFHEFFSLFQFNEMSNVTWQTEFTILPITCYNNFDEINFKNSPSFVSTATNWHS